MVILSAIQVNLALAFVVLVPGITAGYFIWMLRRVVMSPTASLSVKREAPIFELVTLVVFLVPLFLFGIYPAPILRVIDSTVRSLASLWHM